MKIVKEEIENLEITDNTTVVPQPTGAAEKESKTLWQRYMEATKTPEDAPLFGAKNQPTPDKIKEPKSELKEALKEDVDKNSIDFNKLNEICSYIFDTKMDASKQLILSYLDDCLLAATPEEFSDDRSSELTQHELTLKERAADKDVLCTIGTSFYDKNVGKTVHLWIPYDIITKGMNESLNKKRLNERKFRSIYDYIADMQDQYQFESAEEMIDFLENDITDADGGTMLDILEDEYRRDVAADIEDWFDANLNESLSSKLTLDEGLFNEDVVALQEKSVSVKNFLSDIGKIVYALDWYAGNISTNLENDKYAAHFDSPERLGKAAQVSVKALSILGTLMSQKMGYDIKGGGNFLDTSITKKPSAMSERIADLRNLLAEHSAGILVNAPDPRVKNNNNLKNEVSELLKGLRSSLGTLASEVSKVKQGETKGLFNKKFKESLNEDTELDIRAELDKAQKPKDRAELALGLLGNTINKISRLKSSWMPEYMYNLEDDSKVNKIADFAIFLNKALEKALDELDKIKAQNEDEAVDESCNKESKKPLNEDDDFEGFDIDTPADNPEITDEMLQEVIDEVKDTVEEAEFTPEEVVEKVFDCIEDEEIKYELAADVVKSTEEEMAEDELTEALIYGEATLDDYLDVIKKYFRNSSPAEVIDTLFTNNPFMDEATAFEIASSFGEMLDDYEDEGI